MPLLTGQREKMEVSAARREKYCVAIGGVHSLRSFLLESHDISNNSNSYHFCGCLSSSG